MSRAHALIVTFLLWFVLLALGCEAVPSAGVTARTLETEMSSYLAAHDTTAAIDNSQVLLSGKSLERAASYGLPIVPVAVVRLADPELPFDSFMKLYCLCDQILQAAGQRPVYWNGGASISWSAMRGVSFSPFGQVRGEDAEEDKDAMRAFRQRVVADIAAKYEAARLATHGKYGGSAEVSSEDLHFAVIAATAAVAPDGYIDLKARLMLRTTARETSARPYWFLAYEVVPEDSYVRALPVIVNAGGPTAGSPEMQEVAITGEPMAVEIDLSPHATRFLLQDRKHPVSDLRFRIRYSYIGVRSNWVECGAKVTAYDR